MNLDTVGPAELDDFRELLSRRLGLRIEDEKDEVLRALIHERMRALRTRDFAGYRHRLLQEDAVSAQEYRILAERLTVGETYFFRHGAQLTAFAQVALPQRLQARGPGGLRILSAGCATGEEPYSLAITLREQLGKAAPKGAILGVDVNPAFLEHAREARYSEWSLRETTPHMRDRWFTREGSTWVLAPEIRELVSFEEHNLHDENAPLWQPGRFDVIFCRNVTIYFGPAARRALIHRFARSLAPGGFLFLGHAETLRGVSEDFHLRHTHEAFYYQLRDPAEPRRDPNAALDGGLAWPESIQRASDRIAALVRRPEPRERPTPAAPQPLPPRPPEAAPSAPAPRPLDAVIDLFRAERYGEVVRRLESMSQLECDPDALLLRAAALTSQGQLAEAEAVARQLLACDEFNAGAHYIMAMCRESAGDLQAAEEHDRIAIYLDGSFAMPHLHLGLMLRRSGRTNQARRELEEALMLLEREDAARLLLFAGGFGRDAVIQICRAELRASGGEG